MKTHEIDGIMYYDEPYEVDHFAFAYDHLDCDAIITGRIMAYLFGKIQ